MCDLPIYVRINTLTHLFLMNDDLLSLTILDHLG